MTTPSVPTNVTVSGETPRRINKCAIGLKMLVQNLRKRSSIGGLEDFLRHEGVREQR